MKLVPAVILLLLMLFAPARADDEAKPEQKPAASIAELDARIAKALADARIPGASIAVIENNKIILAKGYGVSDLKASTPVTTETIFRAGSISKSLTSIGIMMLVEEGKLSLEDKLADLVPELRFANPWENTDPVRLVHLLEHTSGFDDIDFRHYLLSGSAVPLASAVNLYGPYRSRWRPGTRGSYSNAGPVLAGRIIEKASGQDFAAFMATRLTGPLGMESAWWTRSPAMAGRLSKSYRNAGETEEPFVEILARPSGSLSVTPRDLARIPLLLLGRGTLDGKTYLSPASVARIERTATTIGAKAGLEQGYGLGNMGDVDGKVVFRGHNGAIDGFLAQFQYAPGHGVGYVVMGNLQDGALIRVGDEIRRYLERNLPVAAPKPQPLATRDLEDFPGFYRPITPRQQKMALFLELGWQDVGADRGNLVFNGTPLLHAGNALFQDPNAAAPERVIVRTGEGIEMYTGLGASRQVPKWQVVAILSFAAAFVTALLVSLAFAPFWIIGTLRGTVAASGGLSIRLIPALAMATLLAALFTLQILLAGGDLALLGKPSVPGWMLWALTLAIPVMSAVTLLRALWGAPGANLFVRGLAWLNGAVLATVSIYMFNYGWIGMKLWE
jgi:CubicO group peptidase (beta-lactamase class C family)